MHTPLTEDVVVACAAARAWLATTRASRRSLMPREREHIQSDNEVNHDIGMEQER